jgi:N-acetyltransferase 10
VNIFHTHRQTIQYIQPSDHTRLTQAELLVIDEAAAIPLPMVEKLLGPYLVFMSSTINGYEGTGRSLSMKLVKNLRHQSKVDSSSSSSGEGKTTKLGGGGRVLTEITLEDPIRYGRGDPIERWLNDLLCLDCSNHIPKLIYTIPHPSLCDLYYVNRDTLFSHHKASEAFLQRMMSLYVSSHYKNSPNDLQLMSGKSYHAIPSVHTASWSSYEG